MKILSKQNPKLKAPCCNFENSTLYQLKGWDKIDWLCAECFLQELMDSEADYEVEATYIKKLKPKKEDYPESLTENQTDFYKCKNFCECSTYAEDIKKAKAYAKKIKGQVYTMLDGEDNSTYYLKGFHFVNRFGYCVLKKEEKTNEQTNNLL